MSTVKLNTAPSEGRLISIILFSFFYHADLFFSSVLQCPTLSPRKPECTLKCCSLPGAWPLSFFFLPSCFYLVCGISSIPHSLLLHPPSAMLHGSSWHRILSTSPSPQHHPPFSFSLIPDATLRRRSLALFSSLQAFNCPNTHSFDHLHLLLFPFAKNCGFPLCSPHLTSTRI